MATLPLAFLVTFPSVQLARRRARLAAASESRRSFGTTQPFFLGGGWAFVFSVACADALGSTDRSVAVTVTVPALCVEVIVAV